MQASKAIRMRYIASLSGGLDSSVMWLYLSGYLPGYQVLDALDALTGYEIVRLRGASWDEALEKHNFFLPFHRSRWCTYEFKIKPFERYVGGDSVISYIGLRYDEPERMGYLGGEGKKIAPCYPLREMHLTRADVERIAREVGLPEPGKWSCSCCPFRPHVMWVETVERMPEVAAWCAWVEAEKKRIGGGNYGWIRGCSIQELIDNPILRSQIRRRYWARNGHQSQGRFDWDLELEELPCLMCQVK